MTERDSLDSGIFCISCLSLLREGKDFDLAPSVASPTLWAGLGKGERGVNLRMGPSP